MEKKQDDARTTENEKKPEAAGHHGQPGSVAPDTVTDVELANEKATPEKATAHTDKRDAAAGDKSVAGAAVPPVDNAGKAGNGTKGPLIAALVVVAAIAAGGYYYAQNNQSKPESSAPAATEPASSAPATPPASDADQADQAPAADGTAGSSTSASDATGDAQSLQGASTTTTRASDSDARTAADSAEPTDPASPAQDEVSGSASSTPAGPAASNSEPTQAEAAPDDSATAQSSSTTSKANPSDNASTEATATADAPGQGATGAAAAGTAEDEDTPQASSGAPSAAQPAASAFTGSLPADIRDQLDRQSAQIIALRDQLESSQKQLQQLQASRLQASRDETTRFVVNDVNRLVTMAQNELAIAGNLDNAVTSLETAIKAIDQADAPVLAGLRGALAADIVTLKSAPVIGVDAQFAQVAALVGKMDVLPMLTPDQAGAQPMAGQSSDMTSPEGGASASNPAASSDVWYERAWNEVKTWPAAAWNGLRSDLGGIVRVEKLADPNQTLLTVDQAAQLRGNLKQHLHFAQQALLNGQQGIWTSSLETVVKGVKQSFNQDSVETQQALAQLQQLLKAGVRQPLPPITQSVKAVQETRKQLKSMNPGQE
ncbi:MAG TPA: uroporphyrinogen-III C-methyltransferase [Advenella sp.]|nr:uroporphyrinogen-III C-methyltransferase [Advenella sp.]